MNRSFISVVITNQPLAVSGYFTLTVSVDSNMPIPMPGQFCMIKIPYSLDPILGRPLCVFDFEQGLMTFLVRIMGRGTALLSKLTAGDKVSILGPLGNGFPIVKNSQLPIIVVGGMGIASLYMFIKKYGASALFYGAKTASELIFLDDIKKNCDNLFISTDDGSAGVKGGILDSLERYIAAINSNRLIYCCGPHGMYKAMAERFDRTGLDITVSLEERMACGIGGCLGCVTKTNSNTYSRVCKEGPVFKLNSISFG
ncbi:MAG: dihydroorotate dehydrogenase electron transfer subunit [Nitrospirae bacterium]|nr:dihydroorotate dehydrogenase electron transfer subunit [Nitrospirota bacterium]